MAGENRAIDLYRYFIKKDESPKIKFVLNEINMKEI